MRITVIFDNFGPYHLARLRAAAGVGELAAVEVAASSAEYAWARRDPGAAPWRIVTLLESGTSREVQQRELIQKMDRALEELRPEVVFVPGWSGRAAFAALAWCARRQIPAVTMSESTEWDEARAGWKEAVKRQLVGLCSAALVGGTPHQDYIVRLGLPRDRAFPGYDAVDNDYFSVQAAECARQAAALRHQHGLPEKFFLASNRFIEKKNLPRLLEAYARYRKQAAAPPWDLVLLGDGALRPALIALRSALGVDASVHLPGFKQYPELPAYYGLAGAFIHASTTEQWGLVVNEAMAGGLPVLVSNRCGCATDLVQSGANGFTFDPLDVDQLARLMRQVSAPGFPLAAFGAESRRIIAQWGPERFARGARAAAECALRIGPIPPTFLQTQILKLLLWK